MSIMVNLEQLNKLVDQSTNLGKIADGVKVSDVKRFSSPLDSVKMEGLYKNRLPQTGSWLGEEGNSKWVPEKNDVPSLQNPDNLTWGEMEKKYGFDGISFNNGEADFSEISRGSVEIDDFCGERYGAGGNFDQADNKIAEQRGCSVQEVRQWRSDNNYTWHENQDCKTMLKVPRGIHNNVPHTGGISIFNNKQTDL